MASLFELFSGRLKNRKRVTAQLVPPRQQDREQEETHVAVQLLDCAKHIKVRIEIGLFERSCDGFRTALKTLTRDV